MDRIKDSGSFGPGSSPGGVTKKKKSLESSDFFVETAGFEPATSCL